MYSHPRFYLGVFCWKFCPPETPRLRHVARILRLQRFTGVSARSLARFIVRRALKAVSEERAWNERRTRELMTSLVFIGHLIVQAWNYSCRTTLVSFRRLVLKLKEQNLVKEFNERTHHMPCHYITGPPIGPVLFCSLESIVCRRRLSSSSVTLPAGARAVGRPTMHGGPVRLRPVSATSCWGLNDPFCFEHFLTHPVHYLHMHMRCVISKITI